MGIQAAFRLQSIESFAHSPNAFGVEWKVSVKATPSAYVFDRWARARGARGGPAERGNTRGSHIGPGRSG